MGAILSQLRVVQHNEKQDVDKVLVSSRQFQNWQWEWQVSITQLSILTGHPKPSYLGQGWRTTIHRTLSWKDGLWISINATSVLQPSSTLLLCINNKVNKSLLGSPQHPDDPLAGAPQLVLERRGLKVQWTVNTITNRLKLRYELGPAVRHMGHWWITSLSFILMFSLMWSLYGLYQNDQLCYSCLSLNSPFFSYPSDPVEQNLWG